MLPAREEVNLRRALRWAPRPPESQVVSPFVWTLALLATRAVVLWNHG